MTVNSWTTRPASVEDAHRAISRALTQTKQQAIGQARKYAPRATSTLQGVGAVHESISTIRKWEKRAKAAIALFDKEERTGAVLDLGKDLLGEYVIDRYVPWISVHPYYIIHKAHFRIFEDVVRTLDLSRTALARQQSMFGAVDALVNQLSSTRASLGDARSGAITTRIRERHNSLLVGQWFVRSILEGSTRTQLQQYVAKHGVELINFWFEVNAFERQLEAQADTLLGMLYLARSEQAAIKLIDARLRADVDKLRQANVVGQLAGAAIESEATFEDGYKGGASLDRVSDAVDSYGKFVLDWAQETDRLQDALRTGSLLLAMMRKLQMQ